MRVENLLNGGEVRPHTKVTAVKDLEIELPEGHSLAQIPDFRRKVANQGRFCSLLLRASLDRRPLVTGHLIRFTPRKFGTPLEEKGACFANGSIARLPRSDPSAYILVARRSPVFSLRHPAVVTVAKIPVARRSG